MLLDIALVTDTLMNLLRAQIATSPEAPKVSPLDVQALPPDRLTGDHTIGLYLYHITEDPHYKNLEPPGLDVPPVRFTPMGLNLYYQLTAHSDLLGSTGPENEQTMVGLAMKALRDFPMIDDSTQIGGVQIFPVALQGTTNRFRIVLQPVQPTEAVTYWTAGTLPLRLALYYQASVVLLEPEQSVSRVSRVLTYGVFSFVRGAPYLEGSSNTVQFTLPGAASATTVESQPAQVPVSGKFVLFGSDLLGDETTLLISSLKFKDGVEVGSEWGVVASDTQIFAVVGMTLGLGTVVPGMYSVIAKVIEQRVMPDKSVRNFSKTSNATPFVVVPRITAILPPDLSQRVLVQGGVFQDATGIAADAVEVFVGSTSLSLKAGAAINPGEFEILDAANLRFRYPVAGVASGSTVPFRLIINGAESAPNWVTTP
jgi:hypothetical protein